MEKEYYRIIDIEEIERINNWNRAILVKANKATIKYFNNEPKWFSYTTVEDNTTDWFVFKFSERRLEILLCDARSCDNNELWEIEKQSFTPLSTPILDGDRNFNKIVYFSKIQDDILDYTDTNINTRIPPTVNNTDILEDLCISELAAHEMGTDIDFPIF